jgi:hypothetical protein
VLIEKGITLLQGPSTLGAELETLALEPGDDRLAAVAQEVTAGGE